jgi:hypothetical protein
MRSNLLRTSVLSLLAAVVAILSAACTPPPPSSTPPSVPGRLTYQIRSGGGSVDSGGGSASFVCSPPGVDPPRPFATVHACRMTTGPDFTEPDGVGQVIIYIASVIPSVVSRSLRVVTPDGTAFDFDSVGMSDIPSPCFGSTNDGIEVSGTTWSEDDPSESLSVDVSICQPGIGFREMF